MELDRSQHIKQVNDAATDLAFISTVERFRKLTAANPELDQEMKDSILRSLQVPVEDFKSEIYDRSRVYNGLSLDQRVNTFLTTKILDEIPHREDTLAGTTKVFEFVKKISLH